MFNLFVSFDPESWESSEHEISRDRVITEYTAREIIERYKNLNEKNIDELKKLPCLFVVENEEIPSRIGYINKIRVREKSCVVEFNLDNAFPPLAKGLLKKIGSDIGISDWELSRTHWAVKDEPLLNILLRKNLITQAQINSSSFAEAPMPPVSNLSETAFGGSTFNEKQVFIVHGHDELAKFEMSEYLQNLGLEPIILSLQVSSGRTIIEKIEHYTNVGFAVVLYTPCDIGYKSNSLIMKYRARQNVIFEHGYLIGKLGRNRVAALVKGDIETPNDISGVVYITSDEKGHWKDTLKEEMRSVGYKI